MLQPHKEVAYFLLKIPDCFIVTYKNEKTYFSIEKYFIGYSEKDKKYTFSIKATISGPIETRIFTPKE